MTTQWTPDRVLTFVSWHGVPVLVLDARDGFRLQTGDGQWHVASQGGWRELAYQVVNQHRKKDARGTVQP